MEYKSNASTVFTNYTKKVTAALDSGELQRTVATYLMQDNLRRIHNDGKAVTGKIGNYATSPSLYVNPKNSPKKFATVGKSGKAKFKNGKRHKTKFFQSYKAFRGDIGRETNYVNLQLSGKLKRDFAMQAIGKNYVIGFNSTYGADISDGMEAKYKKKIWGVTKENNEVIFGKIIPNYIKKLNA